MSNIYLSEMQSKDVISIDTGESLGRIVDVLVSEDGTIINFIAESKKIFKRPLKDSTFTFSYENIERIGKDVILVRV